MEKPHTASLRHGRISLPGQVYLVTTATRDRIPYFTDLWAGRHVVNAMRHHAERGGVESLAFVVMPDHLHWLLSLEDSLDLSQLMRSVKGFSAYCLHGHRGRNAAPTEGGRFWQREQQHLGSVWQKTFHDHALRREEDLINVARYVVMNPLRAKLVTSIWNYPLWDAIWVGLPDR